MDCVVFICFAKLLKPSVDSDFRVILNAELPFLPPESDFAEL